MPANPKNATCRTCDYFNLVNRNRGQGECHRYAPHPVSPPTLPYGMLWPYVHSSNEACGDYKRTGREDAD